VGFLDATEVPTGIDVPAKQRACRVSENGFTFGSRDCALRKVTVETGLNPFNNTHHGYSCGEWEMRRVGRSVWDCRVLDQTRDAKPL
jgi:ribosomal protein L37AE/L43A